MSPASYFPLLSATSNISRLNSKYKFWGRNAPQAYAPPGMDRNGGFTEEVEEEGRQPGKAVGGHAASPSTAAVGVLQAMRRRIPGAKSEAEEAGPVLGLVRTNVGEVAC